MAKNLQEECKESPRETPKESLERVSNQKQKNPKELKVWDSKTKPYWNGQELPMAAWRIPLGLKNLRNKTL